MRQFEDRRRLGEINVLRACVAYAQGDLGHAAALLAELRRYADQSHDAQLQAWALIAQATTAARSCDLDQATLQALLHLRQGDWQAAREAVQVALASAGVAPIKCYWLDLYAATAEAAIALWHASRQRGPGEQATARAAAGQAMRSLRRYAHVFPTGPGRPGGGASRRLSGSACATTSCSPTSSSAGTATPPNATSTWSAPASCPPSSGPAVRSLV
jgi:hypothetical protein